MLPALIALALLFAPNESGAWPDLRDRILDRWLAEQPELARSLGLHEYDGKLADYSAAGLTSQTQRLESDRAALAAIAGHVTTSDERLDLAQMQLTVEQRLFRLVTADEPHRAPQFYTELYNVDPYVTGEYAPLAERGRALIAHEEAALAQLGHIRANLRLPLSKAIADNAVSVFGGYAEYLRGDVFKLFGSAGDETQQKRFATANEALARAADELTAWLREVAAQGDQSHVLGKERFLQLLAAQEGLHLSLDQLQHMADADLKRNKDAWEALTKAGVKGDKPTGDLLTLARQQAGDARQLLIDKHLVTIAFDERARVKEAPPFMRWNFAFLMATGPWEKHKLAYYYIAPPDPTWSPEEQAGYVPDVGILLSTTVHEVFPGHFLQGRIQEHAPTRAQQMLSSYSFVEGWAHYGEQLMAEEGAFKTDSARLGQLSDALLRNCRFVVSIGLHTAGMTLDEAARRFRDDCKQDAATATQQALRGAFDPGYFAYTLGKVQILELRAEVQKKLGSRFSLQKFHDALLAHGAPPVPLLRPIVLQELGAK